MEKLILLISFLTLTACAVDEPEGTQTSNPTLIGNWSYVYAGSQCLEMYAFFSNGQFVQSSLDELASGTYTLGQTVNNKIEITLNYLEDNGLPDCLGNSINNAGDSYTVYYSVTNTTLSLYDNSTDTTGYILSRN